MSLRHSDSEKANRRLADGESTERISVSLHLRRGVGIVFHTGFLLALTSGFLGRHVHPVQAVSFQFVAIFLPYLVMLAVGIAAWTAYRKRRVLLTAYGFFLILSAFRFLEWPSRSTYNPESGSVVEIYSSNTVIPLGGWRRNGGKGVPTLRLTPDVKVVALQESVLRFVEEGNRLTGPVFLAARLDSAGFRSLMPEGLPEGRYRQPILSVLPMKSIEQIRLFSGVEERDDFMTRAVLELDGREFAVYNLHLRSFDRDGVGRRFQSNPFQWIKLISIYATDFRVRAEQAVVIRRMVEEETLPVLILGDLNSTPHNWTYAHIRGSFEDATTFLRSGRTFTFPNRFPLVNIDHIFVDEAFRVLDGEVQKVNYSDHRAVKARLHWSDAE